MEMSRKQKLLNIVLMAISMSCCISFAMTLINVGMKSTFLVVWMKAWAIGFAVALPVAFVIPSTISKLVMKLEI